MQAKYINTTLPGSLDEITMFIIRVAKPVKNL